MVILMMVIFIVSSDLGSADHTRPVLASIVRRFLPWLAQRLTSEMIDVTDFIIRKIAHVTEYIVLCLLVSRSFGVSPTSTMRERLVPVGISSLYALSDEFHQSFVPSRGAAYTDVLWDTLGGFLGGATLSFLHRQRQQR
jgi:VanZ family protein